MANEHPAKIVTNKVTVAATATLIAAARFGRSSVLIINEGATDVQIGGSTVTAGTGSLLAGVKGSGLEIEGDAAIYGIVAAGTQVVSYMEAF